MLIILPLLWWLNNSNAVYALLPTESQWYQFQTWVTTSVSRLFIGVTESIESFESTLRPLTPATEPVTPPLSSWLHLNVNSLEDLSQQFDQYHLNQAQLQKILELPQYTKELHEFQPDQEILIKRDAIGNVQKFILTLPFGKELYVHADNQQFYGEIRQRVVQVVTIQRQITHTLLEAAQQAGLSEQLLSSFVKIFRWTFDLVLNSQAGDQFTMIYEQYHLDDDKLEGEILAVEYVHQDQVYRAVRYTDQTGKTAYYTPEGENLRKTFLLTPVEFTKVSSAFGFRRHPIFHKIRLHTGVDYAAPSGTPVTAAGDAKVVFIGWRGGYGKTVILEHSEHYSTLYGHLSKYAEGLQVGQQVRQEQIIGYVGKTGLATAPHLHYGFYIDGTYQNPQQTDLPMAMPMAEEYKADFLVQTKAQVAQLAALSPIKLPVIPMSVAQVKPPSVKFAKIAPPPILQQQTMVSKEVLQKAALILEAR
jgi:murein DD-endopeptidase MepM/ murein hydrolase activator NlpD